MSAVVEDGWETVTKKTHLKESKKQKEQPIVQKKDPEKKRIWRESYRTRIIEQKKNQKTKNWNNLKEPYNFPKEICLECLNTPGFKCIDCNRNDKNSKSCTYCHHSIYSNEVTC